MKKLLFVFAFAFIGQQAFSQMYIVTIGNGSLGGCASASELTLTTVTPTGTETHTCIPQNVLSGGIISLNQELNSIVSQGYKLVETSYGVYSDSNGSGRGLLSYNLTINRGSCFIFAIP